MPNGEFLYGFDMRRNETPAYDLVGRYATDMFTDEAVRNIQGHDKKNPLFLYVSHLAVHAGNTGKLLEAPQDTINRFQHINDVNRRTYAGKYSIKREKTSYFYVFLFFMISHGS